jgi:hypothetical protein
MDSFQETRNEKIEGPQPLNKEVATNLYNDNLYQNEEDYNSEEDPNQVINFDHELKYIKELKGVDIVFVVDCTASMNPFIKGVKRFIRKLIQDAIKTLSQYLVDDEEILCVGMVQYRDHPPEDKTFTTKVTDLTSDFLKFKEEIKKMTAKGGGDLAEAVLDGLNDAVGNVSWREGTEKFIYHILDAPPHGTEFNNYQQTNQSNDKSPNGCPCNLNYEEVLLKMRELEIEYNVVKLNEEIEKMIEVFSNYVKLDIMTPDINYEEKRVLVQSDT